MTGKSGSQIDGRSCFAYATLLIGDGNPLAGMGGRVESGELAIREKSGGRALSTSLFARWVAK